MTRLPIDTFGLGSDVLPKISTVLTQYTDVGTEILFTEHTQYREVVLHTAISGIKIEASVPMVVMKPVDEYAFAVCELSRNLNGVIVVCETFQEPRRVLSVGVDGRLFPHDMIDITPLPG